MTELALFLGVVLGILAVPAGFRAADWFQASRYDRFVLEALRCLASLAGAIALVGFALNGTGQPA